jgi:hypothetical protein
MLADGTEIPPSVFQSLMQSVGLLVSLDCSSFLMTCSRLARGVDPSRPLFCALTESEPSK